MHFLNGQRQIRSAQQRYIDDQPADFIREICAIRGQKHNRSFTTDSTENTDESQRSRKA